MSRAPAPAKVNLALVVGPLRDDGKHEVVTVLQRIDLVDRIELEEAAELRVEGFADDTLVSTALHELAHARGVEPRWRVRIEKKIPVAAGLGGGSSDAATALRLANALRVEPLPDDELHAAARELGADVPYFLVDGPRLGRGDGTDLVQLDLPQDYWIVLVLPGGATKSSTGDVFAAFDARGGEGGYDERSSALLAALEGVRRPRDLAALPPNDLASSPLAAELLGLGAFRADVSGAGPTVYGLFLHENIARAAQRAMSPKGRSWLTAPAWYR
jgi:4-diphosphocytidyl-2-C-methyl-D-erythritol kinase